MSPKAKSHRKRLAERRSPRPRRQRHPRQDKPRICILCEGKVTEMQYFGSIKRELALPSVTIHHVPFEGMKKRIAKLVREDPGWTKSGAWWTKTSAPTSPNLRHGPPRCPDAAPRAQGSLPPFRLPASSTGCCSISNTRRKHSEVPGVVLRRANRLSADFRGICRTTTRPTTGRGKLAPTTATRRSPMQNRPAKLAAPHPRSGASWSGS